MGDGGLKHKKEEICPILQCSKSNIHVAFDLWRSGNSHALLAVSAHFVDENYKIRTVLLAFRGVQGSLSGENIVQTVT